MFDDVLKGAKASKKNKAEEIKPAPQNSSEERSDSAIAASEDETIDTPQKRKSRTTKGKRTDPDFKQVGAYIRKDTYLQIQKLLLEQPDKDFSDLVQELLTEYLNKQLTD